MQWQTALIAAFGSTCRAQGGPEDDANIQALLDAGTPVCTVVGKTWTLHVTEVLRTTLDDNLRIIEQSLAYLQGAGPARDLRRRALLRRLQGRPGLCAGDAARRPCAAARRRWCCAIPTAARCRGKSPRSCARSRRRLDHPFGHPHAQRRRVRVANSLAAVREGAIQVQGTINGYGERCGNANLCSIIPDLEFKLGLRCLPGRQSAPSCTRCRTSWPRWPTWRRTSTRPYVGKSAFAHKGGIHVAAMRRNGQIYQHIDPALVGNQHARGRQRAVRARQLLSKAEEYGLDVNGGDEVADVLNEIKTLEAQGFSFEAAEASVALMLKRQQPGYTPPFELMDFSAIVEHRQGRGIFAEATVKVRVDGESPAHGGRRQRPGQRAGRGAAQGARPALSRTSRNSTWPTTRSASSTATAARRRPRACSLTPQNGTKRWSTVGASANIIEASWRALADAVEYGLTIAYVLSPDNVSRSRLLNLLEEKEL